MFHLGFQGFLTSVLYLPSELALHLPRRPGIVDFKGSTVVDCPDTLHSGADLIVSLSVYVRASAFKPPSTSAEGAPKAMFNQGQETQDEQTLRERKSALLSLFDAVNLRPCRGARVQDNGNMENGSDGMNNKLTQHPGDAKKKRIEIVGDGEEVEIEEGEELSDSELDVIYKKRVSFCDVRLSY